MKRFSIFILCLLSLLSAWSKEHVVQRGETLYSIAQSYNITTDQLLEANPTAANLFFVGLKLNIPESTTTAPAQKPAQQVATQEAPQSNYATQRVPSPQSNTGKQGNADFRTDNDGIPVYYPFFVSAMYEMGDFEYPKYSSSYGLGLYFTSISHWGNVHVGADVNFTTNAGIIKDWGCAIAFGPSIRFDIINNIYVNIPINAICGFSFEGTKTDTNWAVKIAPSLHCFFSKNCGIFLGPQTGVAFIENSSIGVGFQAGLTFIF